MKNQVFTSLENDTLNTFGIATDVATPQVHGQIALANTALLDQSSLTTEMQDYVVAVNRDSKLRQLRDFLMPTRTGPRNAIINTFDFTQPFEVPTPSSTYRGVLAGFGQVDQLYHSKSTRLIPCRGLTVRLDKDQLGIGVQDKIPFDILQKHTEWLFNLAMRCEIQEALTLLKASATVTARLWDGTSDPDVDLEGVKINSADNSQGFYPNRAIIGDKVALYRKLAYRNQLTAGSLASAGKLSDDEIAQAIGLEKVMTNAERYYNSFQGSGATTFSEFVGTCALMWNAVDAQEAQDFTNVVRHTCPAVPAILGTGATTGGGMSPGGDYAVFQTVEGAAAMRVLLTIVWYALPVVQHTLGITQVNVTSNARGI